MRYLNLRHGTGVWCFVSVSPSYKFDTYIVIRYPDIAILPKLGVWCSGAVYYLTYYTFLIFH